jgi:hypothetical protein
VINRNDILCPGCRSPIRLRISIGFEENQRFFFVCPHCQAVLQGNLLTRQATGQILGLEIDGVPAITAKDAESVVNIFTDLPVDPIANSLEPNGSAYLMHFRNLDEAMLTWSEHTSRFRSLIDAEWSNIVRWYGYYVRRDWLRYDEHAKMFFGEDWPAVPNALVRHDAIQRALEVVFLPLFPGGEYVRWNLGVRMSSRGESGNWDAVRHFAERRLKSHDVADVQRDLFDILDQFVRCRWQLLPGMILNVYRAVGVVDDPNWRITRDDFRSLRDLHNSIFEKSYKYLPDVMALNNCLSRGGPDRFPISSSLQLATVERYRAVDKEKVLKTYDSWGGEIAKILDRQLRNAIGHSSATHELFSGDVTGPKIKVRYADFVAQTALGLQVALLCLNVEKLLLIGTL